MFKFEKNVAITDNLQLNSWSKNSKVRHYTRLNCQCQEIKEIFKLYSNKRNHPRGLLAIIEFTFCKYFDADEKDRYLAILKEVANHKKKDPYINITVALDIEFRKDLEIAKRMYIIE